MAQLRQLRIFAFNLIPQTNEPIHPQIVGMTLFGDYF